MSETWLNIASKLRKLAIQNLNPSVTKDRVPVSAQSHFHLVCPSTLWAAIHLPQTLRASSSHLGTALFLSLLRLSSEGTPSLFTTSLCPTFRDDSKASFNPGVLVTSMLSVSQPLGTTALSAVIGPLSVGLTTLNNRTCHL